MNVPKDVDDNERITDWNAYSIPFQSVMPSSMTIVNKSIAQYMYGHTADFGCGSGKIIPMVLRNKRVTRYTGIDSAVDMIAGARWMADRFDGSRVNLIRSKIEDGQLQQIDSALSINSFYIWPSPLKTLQHIHKQLKPGATFVLATINDKLDMPALLSEAAAEMIAHPHWEAFSKHNLRIADSPDINLLRTHQLIDLVHEAGFQVIDAHEKWYMGGLSTIVMERSA